MDELIDGCRSSVLRLLLELLILFCLLVLFVLFVLICFLMIRVGVVFGVCTAGAVDVVGVVMDRVCIRCRLHIIVHPCVYYGPVMTCAF